MLADLLATHPVGEERARTLLGSLLFSGDDTLKLVGDLSGGERARLMMGKLAIEETNLLLLDEPTNHLDIPAQEVLEAALMKYPGAMVLVTHDRALIDAVATRTWAIEDGGIREVLGGYTELQQRPRAASAAGEPHAEPLARAVTGAGARRGDHRGLVLRHPHQDRGRRSGHHRLAAHGHGRGPARAVGRCATRGALSCRAGRRRSRS